MTLDTWYWPLWLVAGFQSAFYIGSMAILPKLLGFTTSYLVVLAAKLVCSTVIDQLGLAGKVVKVSAERIVSLLLVFVGAGLFNAPLGRAASVRAEDREGGRETNSLIKDREVAEQGLKTPALPNNVLQTEEPPKTV